MSTSDHSVALARAGVSDGAVPATTAEDAWRRWLQIILLAAGFLILVAISVASVVLVNNARRDSGSVVHTVEVENQINELLLEIRRTESAARGYLLTLKPQFLAEYEKASEVILSDAEKLATLTSDNPVQIANSKRLRPVLEMRVAELAKAIDFVKRNDIEGGVAMLRDSAGDTARRVSAIAADMRAEEDKLFALRTETADRTQQLSSLVTVAGSALVLVLAAISIFLVRRSAVARDKAEKNSATVTSISKPPSPSAPPICRKRTRKSSASPISSAMTCARRWSTSWALQVNSINCAVTSSRACRA